MRIHRLLPLALLSLAPCWMIPSAAQDLKITELVDLGTVYPMGGQQGRTVAVSLIGDYLDGASSLFVGGKGVTARSVAPVNRNEARAELQIAPDAAPGPRLVRVAGSYGISAPRPFVV